MSESSLAEIIDMMSKFEQLTGKQCGSYLCGPKAYENLRKNLEIKNREDVLYSFRGIRIYQSENVPDGGKYYPATYIEFLR